MWDLSKAKAKEFLQKYFSGFMEERNFIEKRRRDTGISYRKKTLSGFEGIGLGFLDAFPGQQIEYSVYNRNDRIEQMKDQILGTIEPNKKVDKESFSLAFGYTSVNNLRSNRYMPEMFSEEDVKKACTLIEDFMLKTGFPMLERFNDIKELDREINGDNFWTTDWQMPFNLGGDFDIKRIIIAWLAENPHFDMVVDKTYEIMSQNSDGTYYNYDRNDLSLRIPYTVHYLQNLKR